MIGVATFVQSVFGSQLIAGISRFATERSTRRWDDFVLVPTQQLQAGGIGKYRFEGMIVSASERSIHDAVCAMGVPAVNVSGVLRNPALFTLALDDRAIGELAAGYFLDRGYRHFGFAAPSEPMVYALDRGGGFVQAIQNAGYAVTWSGAAPDPLPRGTVRADTSLTRWLQSVPKPFALFAAQDALAASLYATAVAAGVSVPDDIAILGVDNEPNAHFGELGISSVELPVESLGYAAASALDQMLDGHAPQVAATRLSPGRIIPRASTDTWPVRDPYVRDALRFVRMHACEGISVQDVGDAIPIGLRSLQRRLAELMGVTLSGEITRVRIAQAHRLLLSTPMTVQEIAAACGYQHRNHLIAAFRQATSMTPSAFREAHRSSAMSLRAGG